MPLQLIERCHSVDAYIHFNFCLKYGRLNNYVFWDDQFQSGKTLGKIFKEWLTKIEPKHRFLENLPVQMMIEMCALNSWCKTE